MRDETRYLSNVYWSFRRYIAAQLPTVRRYYNPPSQPKPTDVDTWIIFQTGDYDPSLFAIVVPRIHCVSRVDEDGSALIGLVDDVVNIFDNKSTGKRHFSFYDKTSEDILGDIWIEGISVEVEVPYDTGMASKMVRIHSRVKTARKLR